MLMSQIGTCDKQGDKQFVGQGQRRRGGIRSGT